MYFGTISIILFGILFLAFSPKGNSSFSNLPLNNLTGADLFLEQNTASKFEFPDLALIGGTSLKGVSPPNVFRSEVLGTLGEEPEKRDIIEYTVEKGDSLWSVAQKFNISIETILGANEIKDSLIKPGQKLTILPVNGVMHLVKEGDRLEDLAKKYQVEPEKIIEFNELSEDGKLFLDELLIIPGGKIPTEPKIGVKRKFVELSGRAHYYPWGYCTWWVEHKRPIPVSFGNAKNWLDRAIAAGFNVCKGSNCLPEVGAVISLKTSNSLGHVAYVEEVKGDTVIFSEMNYYQFGEMNYRRLKMGHPSIRGYIY